MWTTSNNSQSLGSDRSRHVNTLELNLPVQQRARQVELECVAMWLDRSELRHCEVWVVHVSLWAAIAVMPTPGQKTVALREWQLAWLYFCRQIGFWYLNQVNLASCPLPSWQGSIAELASFSCFFYILLSLIFSTLANQVCSLPKLLQIRKSESSTLP